MIRGLPAATALLVLASTAAAANRPPINADPQRIERVALFGCGENRSDCQITCMGAWGERRFKNVGWVIVYKYPNSTRPWLQMDTPNNIHLIGDAFCDFSKIPIITPLP
jgi:hypothetical protein